MSQLRPFDLALAPDKRRGSFVVGGGEVLDRLLQLFGTAKARAGQGLSGKDAEPDLDRLSQLAEVGVKWNVTLG
jgi:hypothetical protein